ncbi:hypothetical protein Mycsm_06905 (plasmid) [Mycobacterium sp. JS623]|nr:hypothetical protein Mycsm_06905 [Mycobacterium sp. JS623]
MAATAAISTSQPLRRASHRATGPASGCAGLPRLWLLLCHPALSRHGKPLSRNDSHRLLSVSREIATRSAKRRQPSHPCTICGCLRESLLRGRTQRSCGFSPAAARAVVGAFPLAASPAIVEAGRPELVSAPPPTPPAALGERHRAATQAGQNSPSRSQDHPSSTGSPSTSTFPWRTAAVHSASAPHRSQPALNTKAIRHSAAATEWRASLSPPAVPAISLPEPHPDTGRPYVSARDSNRSTAPHQPQGSMRGERVAVDSRDRRPRRRRDEARNEPRQACLMMSAWSPPSRC